MGDLQPVPAARGRPVFYLLQSSAVVPLPWPHLPGRWEMGRRRNSRASGGKIWGKIGGKDKGCSEILWPK